MTKTKLFTIASVATLSLIVLVLLGTTVAAESVKVQGLIKGRNGDTIILKTSDSREVIVLLNDSTEVSQIQEIGRASCRERGRRWRGGERMKSSRRGGRGRDL